MKISTEYIKKLIPQWIVEAANAKGIVDSGWKRTTKNKTYSGNARIGQIEVIRRIFSQEVSDGKFNFLVVETNLDDTEIIAHKFFKTKPNTFLDVLKVEGVNICNDEFQEWFQKLRAQKATNTEDEEEDDEPKTTTGLLEICKQALIESDGGYVAASNILHKLTFATLPKVDDGDGGKEDIDFENNEILALDDSTIRVFAGGDWQEPITFSATLKGDKLYYNNDATEGMVHGATEGLTTKEIIKIIFGVDNPTELKGMRIDDRR